MLVLPSRSFISLVFGCSPPPPAPPTLALKHPLLTTALDLNYMISFLNKPCILLYSSFQEYNNRRRFPKSYGVKTPQIIIYRLNSVVKFKKQKNLKNLVACSLDRSIPPVRLTLVKTLLLPLLQ